MKIAVTTDDGKIVSRHFGRASYYLVLTIENDKVINREMRAKIGHQHFSAQEHTDEHPHTERHGMDESSHNKHVSMAETISDCEYLICGGMGMGAYDSIQRLNLKPVITDLGDIDAVVQAFISGKLTDHTELLH
jgi:predicted Fe-Mo cluster-binding NifX family protein